MAHVLAENLFENRLIGLVGLVVALKNNQNGRSFSPKWAWVLTLRNPRFATDRMLSGCSGKAVFPLGLNSNRVVEC